MEVENVVMSLLLCFIQSYLCLDVIISGSGFSFRGDNLSGSDKSTHSLGRVTIHPIPCQNIILPLSGKDNRCYYI